MKVFCRRHFDQFSLEKVCLPLQKFNKAQTSHWHATDAPPTHLVGYKFKEWSTRRPTVDRRVGWHVGQHVGGIGFFTFTPKMHYFTIKFLPSLSQSNTTIVLLKQKVETAKSKSWFLGRLRHVLILKTCFDVANIIVSHTIFENRWTI